MRPIRLELKGFTAFRERTVLEFAGRRLFAITGPTGAGKSSLLDAIVWALYGRVPRVGANVRQLLAHGETSMSVDFQFAVRGRVYRIARRFGDTSAVRLEQRRGDDWFEVSDRARDVDHEVQDRILRMDYETFTRTIVLPQGEFDSFLRGVPSERRNILSHLIRLDVWEQAGKIARERASSLRRQAQTVRDQLASLAFATPATIEALETRLVALGAEEHALGARGQALARVEELAAGVMTRREALDQATKAADEAARELSVAEVAHRDAEAKRASAAMAAKDAEDARAALTYDRARHDALKAQVALLDQRAEAQAALDRARTEANEAEEAVASATREVADATARLEAADAAAKGATKAVVVGAKDLAGIAGRALRARAIVEAEAATADASAGDAEEQARTHEQRARDLESLAATAAHAVEDRRAASEHAARAARDAKTAATALKRAITARERAATAAEVARNALDGARAEEAAAALSAGLKAGDRCPICGEVIKRLVKHVAPHLDEAEAALADAERALAEAREQHQQAAATVAATGARIDETARALAAVDARLDALDAQAEELGGTRATLAAVAKAAKASATAAKREAEALRREATSKRDVTQRLREELARLPDGLEAVEARRGSATPEDLREAVGAHRAATLEAERASEAAREAARTVETARRTEQTARRDLVRARKARMEVERRLEGLGGVEGDPGAIRRDLAAADALAAKVEEATETVNRARQALAAAEASATATAGAEDAARKRCETRARERDERARTHASARDALLGAWATMVGSDSAPTPAALRSERQRYDSEQKRIAGETADTRRAIEQAARQIEQAARMAGEVDAHEAGANLATSIANELRGDRFIAFLIHEAMTLLAADASARLSQFSSGRFELAADDDEFLVIDHANADERRSVKTLSGGETFLASLALALALSEHLPEISGTGGAISLDSLFLDEGFGSLDAESLDLAVSGLETLATGNRMVGVISHVEELAERLPDRIRVEKAPTGSTVTADLDAAPA